MSTLCFFYFCPHFSRQQRGEGLEFKGFIHILGKKEEYGRQYGMDGWHFARLGEGDYKWFLAKERERGLLDMEI